MDENAVYGHVARNINLFMTFADMMNPYLYIKTMNYLQNVLKIGLEVRGCENLDMIEIENKESNINKEKN